MELNESTITKIEELVEAIAYSNPHARAMVKAAAEKVKNQYKDQLNNPLTSNTTKEIINKQVDAARKKAAQFVGKHQVQARR